MAETTHNQLPDLQRARTVLARELETISTYESLAAGAGEETRALLSHLAAEEKEHVAEALALLRRLDAEQAAKLSEERPGAHFPQAKQALPVPTFGLTVGTLKKRALVQR